MVEVFGSRPGIGERLRIGTVAGAVGTMTLNAVTYLDMAVRRSALVLGGAAMVAGNAGSVATRTTDPRTWSVTDWVSDAVPHLCYGLAAAATAGLLRGRARRW